MGAFLKGSCFGVVMGASVVVVVVVVLVVVVVVVGVSMGVVSMNSGSSMVILLGLVPVRTALEIYKALLCVTLYMLQYQHNVKMISYPVYYFSLD